jgi:hypothetical protein
VLSVVPKGKKDQASKATESEASAWSLESEEVDDENTEKALALAAALVISLANIAALAQQTLDRTRFPPPGPTPVLRVPTWTKTSLQTAPR